MFDYDANTRYDIKIHRNCDFKLLLENDVDMTGYDYDGWVIDSETYLSVQEFTIAVDTALRTITITLTEAETAAITIGNYLYWIREIDDTGFTSQFIWGYVQVYETMVIT